MTAALLTLVATARPTLPDVAVFAVASAIILAGAVGVVVARNPVHSALMLVMTLFGVAVMFVLQQASFLAAVQVIVYAGAIVVLFLFVIMFLGVDREEDIAKEPLRGQRPLAIGLVLLGLTGLLLLGQVSKWTTGQASVSGSDTGAPNVNLLGKALYTTYLFPFEATSALLIIAVVGAVVLARRPPATRPGEAVDETPDDGVVVDRTPGAPGAVTAGDAAAVGSTATGDPSVAPGTDTEDAGVDA
jgi:NADH-quinone oxidoreductase subunit J